MAFFTPDFIQFFQELRANNNRDWFNDNKKRYIAVVKEPFEQYIAAIIERAQIIDPDILITPKDAIFRIYRDTRFSKDKTPYKLHASAAVAKGGRKDMVSPGIYMQFSDQVIEFYSGIYRPDSKQLQRIREHIAVNLEAFESLMNRPEFVTYFEGKIHGERNKRIPKEFVEIAERQDLIYQKQFYYYHSLPADTMLQDDLLDLTMAHFEAARPMSQFFEAALTNDE
ncbi:MAG: DUF2461 domain-containing protein [Bacteroidota bacterium]